MTKQDKQKKEILYRVEVVCRECKTFLLGTNEKPHLTLEKLRADWLGLVMSAPLNTPRCPKCGYSTDRDYNAGGDFLIDDGKNKVGSIEFFREVNNED